MERKLIVAAALLVALSGCTTTQPQPTRYIVPPPYFVMEPCMPWPSLSGEGEVDVRATSRAIRRAKRAHADCQRTAEQAQQYIRMITE